MTKNKINGVKFFICLTVLITVIISVYFLVGYLKKEKLFFYATGNNKKAILNSTWNMTFQEIERVNKCKLKEQYTFVMFEQGINTLLNTDRIKYKKIDALNLWGYNAELTYEFFDNRLFRYTLIGKVDSPIIFDSIVGNNIGVKFNKNTNDSIKFENTVVKDSVTIIFKQFDITNAETEIEHRFIIEGTYLPILNEILQVAKKDRKSIIH